MLLVWGYSFHDLEVLRAINQAFARETQLSLLYLDPFMSEDKALWNVRFTLHDAPIAVDPRFKPKRINWFPSDGLERLITTTIDTLRMEGV